MTKWISTTQVRYIHKWRDCKFPAAISRPLYTSLAGPGAPTGVTVQEQSCVTLKVTWSSPGHTGGLPIIGYNISYTDVVTTTVKGSADERIALLRHLSPGTAYKLKVLAVNMIGQGHKTMTTVSTNHRGTAIYHAAVY